MSAVGSGSSAGSSPQRSESVPCSSSTRTSKRRSVRGSTPVPEILCSCASKVNGYHHEAAERVPVRDVLLAVELLEVEEVLPPLRLLLAAVVVEELREEPARLALLRAREERGADARGLGVALLGLFTSLALVRRRVPRDVRPALEQPAVELVGRDAVLAVVGLDPIEERLLAGLEVGLEVVDGLGAAADLGRPLEAEELLDLLQRVARHRGAQGLARDPVEV